MIHESSGVIGCLHLGPGTFICSGDSTERLKERSKLKPPTLTQREIREALKRGQKGADEMHEKLKDVFQPPRNNLRFKGQK